VAAMTFGAHELSERLPVSKARHGLIVIEP
jgi:hypothetical protein